MFNNSLYILHVNYEFSPSYFLKTNQPKHTFPKLHEQ